MFKFILLICMIPALAMGFTPFRGCGAGIPTGTQFRLPGCMSSPCHVNQGTTVPIQFDFVPHVPATHLTPQMRMCFGGVCLNYDIGMPNACTNLIGNQCPLPANAPSTFHMSFPITTAHPPVPTTVEFTLRNHQGIVVVCGLVDFMVGR